MRLTGIVTAASLLIMLGSVQAETKAGPEYQAVENWLKPDAERQAIGQAHGDVAISSTGEVFVSITGGERAGIQVFSHDGNYLRNVPNAPPDFHGFVIHQESGGEFIYGASLGTGITYKMQLDGKVVLQIDGAAIPDQFKKQQNGKPVLRLTAVDVAPDGRIFIVDGYSSDFIHIFDAAGRYVKSFGGKEAPYSFKTCHKIAIDTRFEPARIVCCDRENRRVVHLSIDGEILGTTPDMMRPAAAVVYGDYAAIGEIEGRVSLLDKEGKVVQQLGANPVKEQTATNQVKPSEWKTGILTAPHGLDFDDEGNLFVTEYNVYGRVVRYNRGK